MSSKIYSFKTYSQEEIDKVISKAQQEAYDDALLILLDLKEIFDIELEQFPIWKNRCMKLIDRQVEKLKSKRGD